MRGDLKSNEIVVIKALVELEKARIKITYFKPYPKEIKFAIKILNSILKKIKDTTGL